MPTIRMVTGSSRTCGRTRRAGTAKAGPAAVLGAGGAARAVVASLLDAGVPEILLSNRTRVRAEALQADFGNRLHVVDWVQAGNMLDDAMTVVNTTSLGMIGNRRFGCRWTGCARCRCH